MLYEPARQATQALLAQHVIGRIWRRDVSVWTPDPLGDAAKSIANRLGWLDVPTGMQPELDRVEALARDARHDGIATLYLLGMGGSSLCAEVMRAVYGVREGYPRIVVMDTTDEAAITSVRAGLDPRRT